MDRPERKAKTQASQKIKEYYEEEEKEKTTYLKIGNLLIPIRTKTTF